MENKPMVRLHILLVFVIALTACSTDRPVNVKESTSAETQKSEPNKGMQALDLSEYSDFADIMVPDKSRSGVDASVSVDDVTGFMHVRAGKRFQMIIREEPTSLEDIKQELQNDLMWRNTISEHDENSIIIEKTLPDGSMGQYHFATVLNGAGSNVVLRSDPMGEFSKKDIERMLFSANTIRSIDGLALVEN